MKQNMTAVIRRMEAAGFNLRLKDGRLQVRNMNGMNEAQRDWLTRNKPALVRHVKALADPNVTMMLELFDATVTAVYPNAGEHSGGGEMDADTTPPPCVTRGEPCG